MHPVRVDISLLLKSRWVIDSNNSDTSVLMVVHGYEVVFSKKPRSSLAQWCKISMLEVYNSYGWNVFCTIAR